MSETCSTQTYLNRYVTLLVTYMQQLTSDNRDYAVVSPPLQATNH